jgi:hypothetical protein
MCGGEMNLGTLDVSGSDGPLKLTLRAMPAAKCAHGHAMPAEDDFMLWLIRELRERAGALQAGSEQGLLLFKKYLCACGKELAAKPERTQSFALELAYEGLPAFNAALEAPVYKCAGCGKEQLRSHKAIRSHVGPAVVSVHDAAGFPHSA